MQNKNVQAEEKDGYSDIVDEMQVTTVCSSTILIDARGSYVSKFEMEDCDLVQLGKQWSMEQFTQWMSNEIF
jgi:hypothetical protein